MEKRYFIKRKDSKLTDLICHFFGLIFILFLAHCQYVSASKPNDFPEALLVVPDATAIRFYALEGTQQVNYQVNICYPGGKVIKELSKGMSQKGWVLLEEDFLNPGMKSNHSRGEWSTFEDQKGNYVYQWLEDWKDSAGNIIRYGLRYMAPNKQNPTKNCNMDVYGIYHSKKILDDTKNEKKGTVE